MSIKPIILLYSDTFYLDRQVSLGVKSKMTFIKALNTFSETKTNSVSVIRLLGLQVIDAVHSGRFRIFIVQFSVFCGDFKMLAFYYFHKINIG